jgi:tetratricopeptide (TPR) repeat protein
MSALLPSLAAAETAETAQYPYAIHAYRESLRFERENAIVWYSLGNTYDELKLHADAVEAYRETVRIQPKTWTPCTAWAWTTPSRASVPR